MLFVHNDMKRGLNQDINSCQCLVVHSSERRSVIRIYQRDSDAMNTSDTKAPHHPAIQPRVNMIYGPRALHGVNYCLQIISDNIHVPRWSHEGSDSPSRVIKLSD